jgi:hypothetical protein
MRFKPYQGHASLHPVHKVTGIVMFRDLTKYMAEPQHVTVAQTARDP